MTSCTPRPRSLALLSLSESLVAPCSPINSQALFYKAKPLPTYDQAMQMFGRGSNTTKEQLIEQLQRRRRESREKRKRAEEELKRQKAAAKGQVEAKL